MRVNVYVDGFNLYYGCLKGTAYKWLDLHALCKRLLRPTDNIQRIRYFTALITSRPGDPGQRDRQKMYIRALETIPQVSVHYGFFLKSNRWMQLVNPVSVSQRKAYVIRTEEKGSDVNLATHLLIDAFDDDFDTAVVISNDSDLAEPIEALINRFGKPVGVINPHKHPSKKLHSVASFFKSIRPGLLAACQFPPSLPGSPHPIVKPSVW